MVTFRSAKLSKTYRRCHNGRNAYIGMSYQQYTSGLDACYNWWGTSPPNTSLFTVGYYSYLNYLPYLLQGLFKESSSFSIATLENSSYSPSQSVDSLLEGIELGSNKKYEAAMDYFIYYLEKHPDNQRAYVELYNCYSNETADDLIKFFNSLPSKASKDYKLLLAYLYLKKGDIKLGKKIDDEIIAENPNTSLATKANINNLYISLYNEDNLADATVKFSSIIKKPELSTSSELSDVDDAIESYARIHNKTVPNLNALKKELAIAINEPEAYELLGNYPNPFNPTTTISYTLSRTSEVELEIYDILGNKIKSFIISSQSAGRQGIIWNGTNSNNEQVASGIYLYHFKVVSLEGKNETFEKTAKLLLIK